MSSGAFVAAIAVRERDAMSDKSSALRAKSDKGRGMAMTQPKGLGRGRPDSSLLVGHSGTAMLPPRALIPVNRGSSECTGTHGESHSC